LEEIECEKEGKDEEVEQHPDGNDEDDLQELLFMNSEEEKKMTNYSSQPFNSPDVVVDERELEQKKHINRMISLTKPKFISTSLSTTLIPASGSAALLYNHWNKSVDDIIEEYEKLYSPEASKNHHRNKREEEEEVDVDDGVDDEEEEETETYYISDSGDDEEMKFSKHPSNWGYYTRIKRMIQRLESQKKEEEEQSTGITTTDIATTTSTKKISETLPEKNQTF